MIDPPFHSEEAYNEAIKAASGWFRVLSLGFMGVAFIEPLRNPSSINGLVVFIAAIVGLFTLGLSLLILTSIVEIKE